MNMKTFNLSRRNFLKATTVAGLGASLGGVSTGCAANGEIVPGGAALKLARPMVAGSKPVHNLTTTPLEKVRVAVIGLSRGMTHVTDCLNIEFAELVAVCDLRDDRAQAAAAACETKRGRRPAV